MFSIYPYIEEQKGYKCPDCGCELSQPTALYFQGMHILADITCTCCEIEYYQTLPIGHGMFFPVAFTKDGYKTRFVPPIKAWRADPLLRSMFGKEEFAPKIEVIQHQKVTKAILLNCLDTCYGHVFQKIANAQRHLDLSSEYGLIMVVPVGFLWMVPEGVAEIWSVQADIKELDKQPRGFDAWVKTQLARFSEVAVSRTLVQPDASKIDWPRFLKHPRFDLGQFLKLPPQVAFIWREDRFWHSNAFEELLFLASRKWHFFSYLKGFFAYRQMRLVRRLAQEVQKEEKKVKFLLVGMGTAGKAPAWFEDLRLDGPYTHGKETIWFPALAASHVVVGVLGSHMLIPTALAAGFVDLVPTRMLGAMGEDIVMPYSNRLLHYMGRFLTGNPSSKVVARQVAGILGGFKDYIRMLT